MGTCGSKPPGSPHNLDDPHSGPVNPPTKKPSLIPLNLLERVGGTRDGTRSNPESKTDSSTNLIESDSSDDKRSTSDGNIISVEDSEGDNNEKDAIDDKSDDDDDDDDEVFDYMEEHYEEKAPQPQPQPQPQAPTKQRTQSRKRCNNNKQKKKQKNKKKSKEFAVQWPSNSRHSTTDHTSTSGNDEDDGNPSVAIGARTATMTPQNAELNWQQAGIGKVLSTGAGFGDDKDTPSSFRSSSDQSASRLQVPIHNPFRKGIVSEEDFNNSRASFHVGGFNSRHHDDHDHAQSVTILPYDAGIPDPATFADSFANDSTAETALKGGEEDDSYDSGVDEGRPRTLAASLHKAHANEQQSQQAIARRSTHSTASTSSYYEEVVGESEDDDEAFEGGSHVASIVQGIEEKIHNESFSASSSVASNFDEHVHVSASLASPVPIRSAANTAALVRNPSYDTTATASSYDEEVIDDETYEAYLQAAHASDGNLSYEAFLKIKEQGGPPATTKKDGAHRHGDRHNRQRHNHQPKALMADDFEAQDPDLRPMTSLSRVQPLSATNLGDSLLYNSLQKIESSNGKLPIPASQQTLAYTLKSRSDRDVNEPPPITPSAVNPFKLAAYLGISTASDEDEHDDADEHDVAPLSQGNLLQMPSALQSSQRQYNGTCGKLHPSSGSSRTSAHHHSQRSSSHQSRPQKQSDGAAAAGPSKSASNEPLSSRSVGSFAGMVLEAHTSELSQISPLTISHVKTNNPHTQTGTILEVSSLRHTSEELPDISPLTVIGFDDGQAVMGKPKLTVPSKKRSKLKRDNAKKDKSSGGAVGAVGATEQEEPYETSTKRTSKKKKRTRSKSKPSRKSKAIPSPPPSPSVRALQDAKSTPVSSTVRTSNRSPRSEMKTEYDEAERRKNASMMREGMTSPPPPVSSPTPPQNTGVKSKSKRRPSGSGKKRQQEQQRGRNNSTSSTSKPEKTKSEHSSDGNTTNNKSTISASNKLKEHRGSDKSKLTKKSQQHQPHYDSDKDVDDDFDPTVFTQSKGDLKGLRDMMRQDSKRPSSSPSQKRKVRKIKYQAPSASARLLDTEGGEEDESVESDRSEFRAKMDAIKARMIQASSNMPLDSKGSPKSGKEEDRKRSKSAKAPVKRKSSSKKSQSVPSASAKVQQKKSASSNTKRKADVSLSPDQTAKGQTKQGGLEDKGKRAQMRATMREEKEENGNSIKRSRSRTREGRSTSPSKRKSSTTSKTGRLSSKKKSSSQGGSSKRKSTNKKAQ